VGPHHSVVITGIARAGIDALIELAGACEQWRLCGGIRTFPYARRWRSFLRCERNRCTGHCAAYCD
jgi:hypothetical protein